MAVISIIKVVEQLFITSLLKIGLNLLYIYIFFSHALKCVSSAVIDWTF